VGGSIANCRLPISDWRFPQFQLATGNQETHRLPPGGTDFIAGYQRNCGPNVFMLEKRKILMEGKDG
jgi:hypothetical protein